MRARALLTALLVCGVIACPSTAGAQEQPGTSNPPTSNPPTSTATSVPTPSDPTIGPVERGTPDDPAGPGAVGPSIDAAAVQRLVELQRAQAVEVARAEAAALAAEAAGTVAGAESALGAATSDLEQARSAVAVARLASKDADSALGRERGRVRRLAVEAYTVAGTGSDAVAAAELRALGTGGSDEELWQIRAYASAGSRVLRERLGAAEQASRGASSSLQEAEEVERAAEARVVGAEQSLEAARAGQVAATVRGQALVDAAASGDYFGQGDGGLTVLGPTLVGPEDLAAFVRARGRPDASIDVEALAAFFVAEGLDQGVRADVAWVQSILETGWFSFANSMVSPGDHNYAGIGACDSCSEGFGFGSPQLGARVQMQLLATYATPGLTSEQLAHPPVRLRPEKSYVRGCCSTWMALSGVWATGPGYGAKILELYNELLDFAVARRAGGVPAVVAGSSGASG